MPRFRCCSAYRPRYKRLVQTALPRDYKDGLNPVAMEKLYYYSVLNPEKMDQVGEYVARRLAKSLRRGREARAALLMEALGQLASGADPRARERIADAFLRTVLLCLASRCPRPQITATLCFIRFVILKDETHYRLYYEQLLMNFVSMCYNTIEDHNIQEEVRRAGIEGVEAILSWGDLIVDNIYSFTHMNVILPCFLYVFNDPEYLRLSPEEREEYSMDSPGIAEYCLKALLERTYASRLHYVLDPMFRYLDEHNLWWDARFPQEVFRLVIESVEPTYAYVLIEKLVKHASYDVTPHPATRARILGMVMDISRAASSEAAGPAAFECVGALLGELARAVRRAEELSSQQTLVRALETLVLALPDYYKLEMMVFVLGRTPCPSRDVADARLRYVLLDVLEEVSSQYNTTHFTISLPEGLLRPLLRISLSPNPQVRLSAHSVVHNIVDRHDNAEKLRAPCADAAGLQLRLHACAALDVAFMRRNALRIFRALFQGFGCFNNSARNVAAVYTSAALFIVEATSQHTLVDALRFLVNVQDLSVMQARQWRWGEYLALALRSLLGLLLLVVPAAEALNREISEWRRPLTPVSLLTPYTLLHRLRVVQCLRSAGWEGVTEQHLGAYADADAHEAAWPRAVTVMHVAVPHAWGAWHRSTTCLSPAHSARSFFQVEIRRPLPPVTPRTVEEESRWNFLTNVLLVDEEGGCFHAFSEQKCEEKEESAMSVEDCDSGVESNREISIEGENEESDEEKCHGELCNTSSCTNEGVTDRTFSLDEDAVSNSISIAEERESVRIVTEIFDSIIDEIVFASISSHSSESSCGCDDSSSGAYKSIVREILTLQATDPSNCLYCDSVDKCLATTNETSSVSSGRIASLTGSSESAPNAEPSYTRCKCKAMVLGMANLEGSSQISDTTIISDKRPHIQNCEISSANTPAKTSKTEPSTPSASDILPGCITPNITFPSDLPNKMGFNQSITLLGNQSNAITTHQSVTIPPAFHSLDEELSQPEKIPAQWDSGVRTYDETVYIDPEFPDDVLDFRTASDPDLMIGEVRDKEVLFHASATAPTPVITVSPTADVLQNGDEIPEILTGAEVIERLKANVDYEAANMRLKALQDQARLHVHYRTKSFDELRPQDQQQMEDRLRATLAATLRTVPAPSDPPPAPPSLWPRVRPALLHISHDDVEEHLLA